MARMKCAMEQVCLLILHACAMFELWREEIDCLGMATPMISVQR